MVEVVWVTKTLGFLSVGVLALGVSIAAGGWLECRSGKLGSSLWHTRAGSGVVGVCWLTVAGTSTDGGGLRSG